MKKKHVLIGVIALAALIIVVVPNVTGKVGTYNFGPASDDEMTVDDYPIYSTVCGNGILESGEECDDGNMVDGDGCETDCTVSPTTLVAPITLFVTSIRYNGNLKGSLGDGLAGADMKCQQRANAAGLDGTYFALLSTTYKNAIDRVSNLGASVHRVDGVVLVPSARNLFDRTVLNNRILTEYGLVPLGIKWVWTGSFKNGNLAHEFNGPSIYACNDWTRNSGNDGKIGSAFRNDGWNWLSASRVNCGQRNRLYCLEYSE